MPNPAPLSSTLKVRIEAELRAELEREAAATHRRPSALARAILHDYFAARRGERKAASHA